MLGGECYVMFVSRQSVLVRRAQLIILRDERQVVAADCRAAPWRSLTPGLRDKKTFIQTKVRTLTLGCISQLLDCSNILFITTIYLRSISEINFEENCLDLILFWKLWNNNLALYFADLFCYLIDLE